MVGLDVCEDFLVVVGDTLLALVKACFRNLNIRTSENKYRHISNIDRCRSFTSFTVKMKNIMGSVFKLGVFSCQATENGYIQMWRFDDGFRKTFLPDMGRKVSLSKISFDEINMI